MTFYLAWLPVTPCPHPFGIGSAPSLAEIRHSGNNVRRAGNSTAPALLPALKPSNLNSLQKQSPSALVLGPLCRKCGRHTRIFSGCIESNFHHNPFRNVACGSLRCAGNSRAASNMIWVRLYSSCRAEAKLLPSLAGLRCEGHQHGTWKVLAKPSPCQSICFRPVASFLIVRGRLYSMPLVKRNTTLRRFWTNSHSLDGKPCP